MVNHNDLLPKDLVFLVLGYSLDLRKYNIDRKIPPVYFIFNLIWHTAIDELM